MPEKRRATGGQAKRQRPTTQTTLKDLFQRTNSGTVPAEQELHPEYTDTVAHSLPEADPCPPAQPSRPPKPSQLFPIFTKVSSMREKPRDTVITVDDTEVIDITDMSSDMELSEEPSLSSAHQPSSQATSHSPPPSPMHLTCSDTSFPHAGTHGNPHPYKSSKKKSNKRTPGLGDVVPFPSSCSQHVRGVQHSYTSSQAPLERRVFPSLRPSDGGTLDFLAKWRQVNDTPSTPLDRIRRSLTPQQCEEHIQSLSRDYAESHPAFAQISVQQDRNPLRHAEMWTRRFRPQRANEVLGNERHTLYLRDWLRALELQLRGHRPEELVSKSTTVGENKGKSTLKKKAEPRGVKRPRVVRAVARKRGNKKRRVDSDDDLGDFVVFSDADEEEADDPPEDSEDELAFCQRTLSRLRRNTTETRGTLNNPDTETDRTTSQPQESVQTKFSDHLTNTLLITGPHGCGKTAAVYACAEELGWEVFEVYPGIGRRNGASLDQLVGDVGRNHIVQTVQRPTRTTKERVGLGGYLEKRKTGEFAESQEAGSQGQPISIEDGSPTHGLQPLPRDEEMESLAISEKFQEGSRPIVRQSLVLLEEVDILFKEDAGFWPAVVEFIRSCQRPVVMTCNDPGLVPVADLPLQNVLVFEPCPSSVAATFLQCVSLAEGWLVPHEDLVVLYESTHSMDGIDIPDARDYPRTERVGTGDLRRSITELQMLCAGARHGSASEMHQDDEAEGHVRRSARPISAASRVTATGSTADREWWRKMKGHSELMSRVDAERCRLPLDMEEVKLYGSVREERLTMGSQVVTEEGEIVLEEREGQVFDELIAEEAIRHSRGVHEESGTGPIEASINPATWARVEYQSRMVEALQDILDGRVMGQGMGVYLDYIPWVRHMVLVDDELERRAWDVRGGGRCTRNSLRTVHARSVVVKEGQRAVWRTSRFM